MVVILMFTTIPSTFDRRHGFLYLNGKFLDRQKRTLVSDDFISDPFGEMQNNLITRT